MSSSLQNIFLQSNLSVRLLAKDAVFYGIISGMSRASALFLVPLLTRTLSLGNFAIVDTLLVVSNFILVVGNGGIDSALMYHYHHVSDEDREKFVATGLWLRFLGGLLLTLLAVLLSPFLGAIVFGSENYSLWTLLVFLSIPFSLFTTYCLDLLRIEHERRWFLVVSVFRLVVLVGGTWLILSGFDSQRIESFLLFRMLPEIAAGALLFIVLIRKHNLLRFGLDPAKKLLRYGAPLVPAAFLLWALGFVDRWVLFKYVTPEEVGFYAVAVKVGMVVTLLTGAVQMSFNPFSMAVKGDSRSGVFYARAFGVTMFAGVASVLLLAANLPVIVRILGGSIYLQGQHAALILLFANLGHMVFVFSSTGANIQAKTIYHAYAIAAGLLIALGALHVFVPLWGMMGAAAGTLCGFAVLAAVSLLLSQRVHHIPYNGGVVIAGVIIAGISAGATSFLPSSGLLVLLIRNLIAIGTVAALLRLMLGKEETLRLRTFLATYRFMKWSQVG